MNNLQKTTSKVNYETQWRHTYVEPKDYLYFEANKPIQEIVQELERHMNKLFPHLNVNYKPYVSHFHRLYRNIISNYKNWQVLYRNPGSKKDYHAIDSKISYQPRGPKTSLQQTILTNPMVWKHDLEPLIKAVKIDKVKVNNCDEIAKLLNAQIEDVSFKPLLTEWKDSIENLSKSYDTLYQNSDMLPFFFQKENAWKLFSNSLKTINKNYQSLNIGNSNDYRVHSSNINHVLQKGHKSTKGWRVNF